MQKRLTIEPGLPLAEALATAFEVMLVEARDRADKALDEPHPSLHNYRRALRRAEAMLELCGPFLRKTPHAWLSISIDRARRKTRLLRDIDAVMGVIESIEKRALETRKEADGKDEEADGGYETKLAPTPDGSADEGPQTQAPADEANGGTPAVAPASPLRALVEAFRGELATSELIAWRLRKNLRALAGLSSIFKAAVAWVDEDALVDSMRASYRDARKAKKTAAKKGTAEALYNFRKAARTLRYQLELLASRENAPLEFEAAAKDVAKIASKLGELTDIFALRAMVLSTDRETLEASPKKLARNLEELARSRTEAIFELADTVFKPKATDFLRQPEVAVADGEDADTTGATESSDDLCHDGDDTTRDVGTAMEGLANADD